MSAIFSRILIAMFVLVGTQYSFGSKDPEAVQSLFDPCYKLPKLELLKAKKLGDKLRSYKDIPLRQTSNLDTSFVKTTCSKVLGSDESKGKITVTGKDILLKFYKDQKFLGSQEIKAGKYFEKDDQGKPLSSGDIPKGAFPFLDFFSPQYLFRNFHNFDWIFSHSGSLYLYVFELKEAKTPFNHFILKVNDKNLKLESLYYKDKLKNEINWNLR